MRTVSAKTVPTIVQNYYGKTRRERHEELLAHAIRGAIHQARIAYEGAGGQGRIHMNVLWEMAGAERVLNAVMEGAKGLIHGITCGAGMPYRLAELAARFGVQYYPIISSARAFRALWKRAYRKFPNLLGGVVYEDPWRAGGHNGLSNVEDPNRPEDPRPRVVLLRKQMTEVGLAHVPIIMAGGVWWLDEWSHWIEDPDIAPVAFQFGTRPLLTQESPISDEWKRKLLTLEEGDVFLNRFSPTGFYSSAVRNAFPGRIAANARSTRSHSPRNPWAATTSHSLSVRAGGRSMSPATTSSAPRAWIGAGYLGGHADARLDPGVRDAGATATDPDGPDRMHGLPVRLPVQQLVAERGRHHRPQDRPPVFLHPEDPATDQPRRFGRGAVDVLRPQRLPLPVWTPSTRTGSCRPSRSSSSAS